MANTFIFPRSNIVFPSELDDLSDFHAARDHSLYRVALLIPMCGSAGIWAPSCISSAQVAVEELNQAGGIQGREIELLIIDSALESVNPIEITLNELITYGSIDAIVGMHLSAMRQRLSGIVQQRVPYIYTPLYEGGETTHGIFAIGETPPQQLGPALKALQDQYRPRSWALIGNDYVWPRSSHLYAKEKLRAMSVDLAYERYLSFGISDMSYYVGEIEASGAEAVLISLVGQDGVTFNRAFGEAALDRRMIRLSCAIEENTLLASGTENLKRLFSASSYFGNLNTEANRAFKERYHTLHGDDGPVLNAIGQSTYEGIHFLSGLLADEETNWRMTTSHDFAHLTHRSAREGDINMIDGHRKPIYLARADGIQFDIVKRI